VSKVEYYKSYLDFVIATNTNNQERNTEITTLLGIATAEKDAAIAEKNT
jgi:hypothetical protein